MKRIKYSFIVPVYSDKRVINTVRCFLSAEKADESECLVVCNGSSPEFVRKLQSRYSTISNVKIICASRGNISLARNIGVLHAKGKYVVFIDSDCTFKKNYISVLNSIVRGQDAIRGRVMFKSGKDSFENLNAWMRNMFDEMFPGSLYMPNLIVKRSVFRLVGLYNEDLSGSEDTEWSQRFVSNSSLRSEYCPQLLVQHACDNQEKVQGKTWKLYGIGQSYRARKAMCCSSVSWHKAFRKAFGELSLCKWQYGLSKNLFITKYVRFKLAGFVLGWFHLWKGYDQIKYAEVDAHLLSSEYRKSIKKSVITS